MSVKDMFASMKSNGYITRPLDEYLFKYANRPNDRAINVNAPSAAGGCIRGNYYARKQYDKDDTIAPKTQRIFDNGNHVHTRLQEYLLDMHLLIMDEVPLINDEYNIQGHTDGYLDLKDEVAILEIKSINSKQFAVLKDAKDAHKRQGLIYLFCAEERRKYLHATYKDREEFNASVEEREEYFREHYQHIVDGHKYTREQKIENEVDLNIISDDILFDTDKPITKVIFLYECKDTQELKEFVLERNATTEGILDEVLEEYVVLNEYCDRDEVPPRVEGATKSGTCRWCDYKNTCWVV